MARATWFKFFPDRYLVGTRKMLPLDRGLYWDVCALIMSHRGPIKDDEKEIARALGVDRRTWRLSKARILAADKLQLIDGYLTNGMAIEVSSDAELRVVRARIAGESSANHRRIQGELNFKPAKINGLASTGGPEVEVEVDKDSHTETPSDSLVDGSCVLTRAREARDPPTNAPASRARLIPDDWEPSDELLARIRKGRPDLVGKLYADQLENFRDWCRAKAPTTFNTDSTFASFMRRTPANGHGKPSFDDERLAKVRAEIKRQSDEFEERERAGKK